MEHKRAKTWSLRQFSTNYIINISREMQFKIAQASSSDLRLKYQSVSYLRGVVFERASADLHLRDLDTSDGIYVNNVKIEKGESRAVSKGDIIGFGVKCFENAAMEDMPCFFEVLLDDVEPIRNDSTSGKTSDGKDEQQKHGNHRAVFYTGKNLRKLKKLEPFRKSNK